MSLTWTMSLYGAALPQQGWWWLLVEELQWNHSLQGGMGGGGQVPATLFFCALTWAWKLTDEGGPTSMQIFALFLLK